MNKALGWTSHDAVARVRRLTGQKQVGHAGTLDPLAGGVLLIVLGGATRLSSYLMAGSKVYCAEVVLGATTATDDSEGELQRSAPTHHITREAVDRAAHGFLGPIMQVPPRYAAVRQGGQRLYVQARKGVVVDPEPRAVNVQAIDVLGWAPPRLRLRIQCGSGTYIRSLARDLGESLGVGGYLHALQRIRSGRFTVDRCVSIDALKERRDVEMRVLPMDYAVVDWPALVLEDEEEEMVRVGRSIQVAALPDGDVRLYTESGALLALARADRGVAKPFRVFGGPEAVHAHCS